MPKKAPQNDSIDPVRSRLAGAVAGPPPVPAKSAPAPKPDLVPETQPPATVQPQSVKLKARPVASSSSMTVNRKFMVSPQEADQIKQTLNMLEETFKSKITLSQATRAMWTILAGSEEAMQQAGRRRVKRTAPSTGNAMAMAEYEEEVAEFLETVLKRS